MLAYALTHTYNPCMTPTTGLQPRVYRENRKLARLSMSLLVFKVSLWFRSGRLQLASCANPLPRREVSSWVAAKSSAGNSPVGLLASEMQTSLLATATAQPVCAARGGPLGTKRNAGSSNLLQDLKQKAMAQTSGSRQKCVHIRAANSSSGSVNSTNTRTQESSAPAMAAASRPSHAQSDSQPQEGMLDSRLVTCCHAPGITVLTYSCLSSRPHYCSYQEITVHVDMYMLLV